MLWIAAKWCQMDGLLCLSFWTEWKPVQHGEWTFLQLTFISNMSVMNCLILPLSDCAVSTEIAVKRTAFWEVALCRLVEADRHFGGAVFLHHHGDVRTLILTWETERNHEKPHRGYTVSRLRFELESSEIWNRNSDHYSTKLGVAAVSYCSSKGVGCFSLQTETVFIETET
jgi:hypothetical protein